MNKRYILGTETGCGENGGGAVLSTLSLHVDARPGKVGTRPMENMIRRIVEMDQKARQITEAAQREKLDSEKESKRTR